MAAAPMDLSAGFVPAPTASGAPVDLSAGLVPAQQSQAQPQQTSQQPTQQPTQQPGGSVWDSIKQGARATLDSALDPVKGGLEGVADTAAGVGSVAHRVGEAIHPGLGEFVAPADDIQTFRDLATPSNGTQRVYKGIEGVAEFMLGDEALKGMSVADKLAKVAPVLQKLSKSPDLLNIAEKTIAATRAVEQNRVAGTAIRQAVVGGTQGLAHGDTTGGAAAEAGIAGAGGALGEGVGALYDAVRPGERVIAGVKIPTLASQDKGAGRLAKAAANIEQEPGIAAQQQAGSQQVIQNVAQDAVRNTLQKMNASRMPLEAITNPSRLLEAPGDMKPYQFELPTGPAGMDIPESSQMAYPADSVPVGEVPYTQGADGVMTPNPSSTVPRSAEQPGTVQYLTGIKPGAEPAELGQPTVRGGGVLTTTDPAVAQTHLSGLNRAFEESGDSEIGAARDRLQDQLDMFHAAKVAGPKFSPIDTEAAARQVNSFGDGADQIQASAQPVYKRLDQLSNGLFTAMRNQQKAALKVIQNGNSMEAIDGAHQKYQDASDAIDKLFRDNRTKISKPDYDAAQQAWKTSKTLEKVHATVEGMFNGDPSKLAAKYPKEFSREIVKANTARMKALEQRTRPGELRDAIGSDGVENLYRVNSLMQDTAKAARTHGTLHAVAQYAKIHGLHIGVGAALGGLGFELSGKKWSEGAALGIGAELGGRQMLRVAATSPRIGQMLDYAVQHNVNPRVAIPLLAGTMAQGAQTFQEPAQ